MPKTLPMRMHKNMVIHCLRSATRPDEVAEMMPDYTDAEAAIRDLEAHPGEWIVGGELLTPEQYDKIRDKYEPTPQGRG